MPGRHLRHEGSPAALCNAPRLDAPPTLATMPRPLTDRQRWQEELAELPSQVARRQVELAALAPGDRVRREMLEWMIRRVSRGRPIPFVRIPGVSAATR